MQTALEVTAGSSCSPADDEGVGSTEPELAPPLVPARLRAPFLWRPGGPPLACAEGCPGAFDAWPPLAWVAGSADDEGPLLAWVVLPVDAAGEAAREGWDGRCVHEMVCFSMVERLIWFKLCRCVTDLWFKRERQFVQFILGS